MKHSITVHVSKKPMCGGVVACRTVTMRERLMRLFFGNPHKVTILVPGDSVESLAIREIDSGGDEVAS